ncbi:hypothetical protein HYN69_14305 [Gemmobacter aquarius]|uniref:Putative Flp pilus-assembly TadG-like N-terminal domain-containing protein n=1 Tax=Paragemmobacter aquarius TaxID=2169400 RepID=A0A2S0UNZ3_9RHOB|nr:pilus assembly protein TadG-related protein [Gemmobacter aquarius]AWB49515.1 hypothetical protein HYN69_14305 [Gemmobacter aquarius]
MKHFLRSETGYAFLLTLIFLPVFMGVSLLVIDVGRAHNAQQDLQAAADALALAGAAELDGQPASRARAKTAMAKLSGAASNSVSFLGLPPNAGAVTLPYTVDSTAPFQVTFLKTIPLSDDDVIGGKYLTDNVAKSDFEARFVHVFARSNNLASFFFSPATRKRSELLIGATAVATQSRSTCDLTPMFMCSPFSGQKNPSAKDRLLTAFAAGDLHGQMFKLQTNPSGSLVSGNIGYLDTIGRSTDAVSRGLAGEPYPQCIELTDQVIPKTGAVASAWDGFNVRFDITSKGGPTSFAANTAFPAAKNVRKGWPVGQCELTGSFKGRQDFTQFPRFSDNRGPAIDAVRNSGTWNLTQAVTIPNSKKNAPSYIFPAYWPTLYPTTPLIEANVTSYAGKQPSRYDIYMYEQKMGLVSTASAGNETGLPSCITKKTDTSWEDRRTMLIAIVDCDGSTNGNAPLTVDAYAKVFLVNPVTGALDTGSDTLDIEIVDLSERSNGSIRNFIRDDIVLVR